MVADGRIDAPSPRARSALSRLRILVLGYVVRGPLGGLVWHHLQFVLGLKDLGHEVYFLEDSDDYAACYDPLSGATGTDPAYGLEFLDRTFRSVGLGDRWAYCDAHSGRRYGPCAGKIPDLGASAELLINLSGMNPLRPWMLQVPARALVDTDPVFTQIRHLTDPIWRRRASGHTAFFTFGENLPRRDGGVPDDGLPWQPARQPVVLRVWPAIPAPANGRLTCVMQWDSYPAAVYRDHCFGMKSRSFAPYLDLPARTHAGLELALGGASAPRALLARHGWALRDPLQVTRSAWRYRRYLQRSKAEFGIAKHGYVAARSGWFSERSANYLASGRPVLVQETGFSEWLDSGIGVIPFGTPEAAIAGIDEIEGRYRLHCEAARAIADAYFGAPKVLTSLIERSLSASPHRETPAECR
jgi:hypothetical protein